MSTRTCALISQLFQIVMIKKKKIKVDKNWKHTETLFWKCSILQLNVLKKLKHNQTFPFCSQSDVEQDKDEARWWKRQQFKAFRTAAAYCTTAELAAQCKPNSCYLKENQIST